ncbi:hypothetical protein [Sorangium sp. So ce117]|uniref:hypothetical protein n=1 Tax=Sorangium sp. So ce117 TaxID=3133277 RepID=UPI003F5FA30C
MARERGDLVGAIAAGGTARTFAPLRRGHGAAIAAHGAAVAALARSPMPRQRRTRGGAAAVGKLAPVEPRPPRTFVTRRLAQGRLAAALAMPARDEGGAPASAHAHPRTSYVAP